jgi:GntR family transcriptional regulator
MAQQPMYQVIAEDLRAKIESGVLARGSQLPTEGELQEQYGAARNTIRDAIKRLGGQGLVETRPGQGTFVMPEIDPFVTVLTPDSSDVGKGDGATYLSEVNAHHRRAEMTLPIVQVQPASAEIAKRLRVAPGTHVVSRHQQRYIDDLPWSLQTSFYPMVFASQAPRLIQPEHILPGVVHYLGETMNLQQIGWRDWITARTPDDNEVQFFNISHDSTVFEIFRTAFDQNKKPMRVTVTVFPTDRNQFIVNVGDGIPDPRYEDNPEEYDEKPGMTA